MKKTTNRPFQHLERGILSLAGGFAGFVLLYATHTIMAVSLIVGMMTVAVAGLLLGLLVPRPFVALFLVLLIPGLAAGSYSACLAGPDDTECFFLSRQDPLNDPVRAVLFVLATAAGYAAFRVWRHRTRARRDATASVVG